MPFSSTDLSQAGHVPGVLQGKTVFQGGWNATTRFLAKKKKKKKGHIVGFNLFLNSLCAPRVLSSIKLEVRLSKAPAEGPHKKIVTSQYLWKISYNFRSLKPTFDT